MEIHKVFGLGSKMAARKWWMGDWLSGGVLRNPLLPPQASPPSCCSGSAAILLPRPDMFRIISKY